MESLISNTITSKEKIITLFKVSLVDLGGYYIVKITNIKNNSIEFVDLKRPDIRIYVSSYAP